MIALNKKDFNLFQILILFLYFFIHQINQNVLFFCMLESKKIQGKYLRIFLRNHVSYGISCGFICEKTLPGEFPAVFTAELPADCSQESFM
jgi:hypothetical protein